MEIINTVVEWALFFTILSCVLMALVYIAVGTAALVMSSILSKKARALKRMAYGPSKDAVLCVKHLMDSNGVPERKHTFIEPVVESNYKMLKRNLEVVENDL